MKTNAARLLDARNIPYELRSYAVDEAHLDAETVARKVGLPPEQVWKTLVVRGDRNGVLLAVVPGDCELDPKALARLSGDSAVEPVALRELTPLTGYVRGGVTVFGCKKPYPVFCDETVILHDVISVSAGMRGLQILLRPEDYLIAAQATVGPISRPKSAARGSQ